MGGTRSRTTEPAAHTVLRPAKRLFRSPAAHWLFAVSLFSLILHLPFFRLPMISDEGGYAYVAQRWFDGRGTL